MTIKDRLVRLEAARCETKRYAVHWQDGRETVEGCILPLLHAALSPDHGGILKIQPLHSMKLNYLEKLAMWGLEEPLTN